MSHTFVGEVRLSIILPLAACLSLAAAPVAAEGRSSRLLHLGSRTFDLGIDAGRLRGHPREPGEARQFIPVFDVPWLFAFSQNDSDFRRVMFHIDLKVQDVQYPLEFEGRWYPYETGIPERMEVDGYEARGNDPEESVDVMYLPLNGPRDFSVRCSRGHNGSESGWTDQVAICFVSVSYPPDSRIVLLARVYGAEPFEEVSARFDDIARRMREIACCLDDTEELAAGTWTPTPAEGLDGDLSGCAPEVVM